VAGRAARREPSLLATFKYFPPFINSSVYAR